MSYCDKCDKMFASRQSLWKHRQRKHAGKKENNIAHKEKFLADIMNNVTQRAKDQPITSTLPIKRVNSVVPKPKALIDFKSEKKLESEAASDSEDQSTTSYSDSEPEEIDISENDEPDNLEELKAAFRNLYKKVHSNMENYNKLVLILDELYHVNCLTKEECDGIKLSLRKKIGIV